MITLGLTGGIGMGKTTVGNFLREQNVQTIDTDEIAREVVRAGQPGLERVVAEFGEEVATEAGELDRAALARIVFGEESKRKRLEEILHPLIREIWIKKLESKRELKDSGPVAVIIPLLFETNAEVFFDRVICVACSEQTQRKRLAGRGWSDAHVDQRLRAQWPVVRKMDKADYVVWNEAHPEMCKRQVIKILGALNAKN